MNFLLSKLRPKWLEWVVNLSCKLRTNYFNLRMYSVLIMLLNQLDPQHHHMGETLLWLVRPKLVFRQLLGLEITDPLRIRVISL